MKKKLYWSITNACNLACAYCYYNTGLEGRVYAQNLSLDYQKAAKIVATNFEEIIFTGGEPLLFSGLDKLIAILKSKKRKVGILTNATLLTEAKCHDLLLLGIDSISISLDSLDEKINDSIRGRSKAAREGVENIVAARKKVPTLELEIMTTVTKKNISSIYSLVDFCQKNNIRLWLDPVEAAQNHTKAKDLDLTTLSQKDFANLSKAMYYWSDRADDPSIAQYVENCLTLIQGKKPDKIVCPMGTENFILDPDGSMYPCFLRKEIDMGNIFEMTMKAILNNSALKNEQKKLHNAQCVRLGCVCMTIANDYSSRE